MKELALMFGGCFVMLIGFYARHKKRDVGLWLSARRIDKAEKIKNARCPECGGKMKIREYKSGHRKGAAPLVCEYWPDCKNVKWC